MSEYDIALDCQVDWASFWSSESGRSLFRALAEAVSKKREGKGEKYFRELVDYDVDELQLTLMPITYGECYYWSPQMLEIVRSAAGSLPDSWALMKQHIPSVSGFFYFAKEINEHCKAMGWTALKQEGDAAALYVDNTSMPDFNAVSLTSFLTNPEFPRPIPARTTMHLGESIKDWKMAAVYEANRLNADVNDVGGHVQSVRLFATMLTFLQQRILVPSRWSVGRATRRRIATYIREDEEPSVNVIRLRNILRRPQETEGEAVVWNCRWIVRGHWRDQWYSSLGRHQPLFIDPYVKGPEDKPLRNPSRLFAVVR